MCHHIRSNANSCYYYGLYGDKELPHTHLGVIQVLRNADGGVKFPGKSVT